MTIVQILDTIKEWVEENVCNEIELKAAENEQMGGQYEYKLVHPSAYIGFLPDKSMLDVEENQVPSICVQIDKGNDKYSEREMNIILGLSVWNPGIHTKKGFKRKSEGWRDLWNLADIILRKIESADNLNGISVDKESIGYEPEKEQDSIQSYYPFFFGNITFSINSTLVRRRESDKYL